MSGHAKDMRALMDRARTAGMDVRVDGSGHWRVTAPDGRCCSASVSPRSPVAYKKALSKLRRLGVDV